MKRKDSTITRRTPLERGGKLPQRRKVLCRVCGAPATCYGRYEGCGDIEFGCDEHCGHGNEDGWCKPISEWNPRNVLRVVEEDEA